MTGDEMETTTDGPTEVPLIELLRSIPPDARLSVEDDWKSSRTFPVGILCQRAAEVIERQAEALDLISLSFEVERIHTLAEEALAAPEPAP